MRIISTLFSLIVLIFAVEIFAQNAESGKDQKIKKTAVSIPVMVSDREGRYISGLKKDDFTLYQSGVEQKIESVTTFDEPLDIALLLDTSGSTKNSLKEIKEAAKDFVELLNPSDRCLIATFDTELKNINTFTADRKMLKKSLDQIVTAEKVGSVLFDAIDNAAQKSFNASQNRKIILVLSDGKDAGSLIAKNDLLAKFEESEISVYTVFYQTGLGFNKLVIDADGTIKEGKETKPKKIKPPKKKKNYSILIPTRGDVHTEKDAKLLGKATDIEAVNFFEEISDLTAGRFYQSDAPNLSGIFKKIAGELRQQYRLNYFTKEVFTATTIPEITVKVNRPDAVVQKRGKFRAKQL